MEFVEGYDARLVGFFKVGKNLLQGERRMGDITQFKVKSGHISHKVDTELAAQRLEGLDKSCQHFLTERHNALKDVFAEQESELP